MTEQIKESKTEQKIEAKTETSAKEDLQSKRTKCEVYSRVVGYLRPVQQWNDGKRTEFFDRTTFTPNTQLKVEVPV